MKSSKLYSKNFKKSKRISRKRSNKKSMGRKRSNKNKDGMNFISAAINSPQIIEIYYSLWSTVNKKLFNTPNKILGSILVVGCILPTILIYKDILSFNPYSVKTFKTDMIKDHFRLAENMALKTIDFSDSIALNEIIKYNHNHDKSALTAIIKSMFKNEDKTIDNISATELLLSPFKKLLSTYITVDTMIIRYTEEYENATNRYNDFLHNGAKTNTTSRILHLEELFNEMESQKINIPAKDLNYIGTGLNMFTNSVFGYNVTDLKEISPISCDEFVKTYTNFAIDQLDSSYITNTEIKMFQNHLNAEIEIYCSNSNAHIERLINDASITSSDIFFQLKIIAGIITVLLLLSLILDQFFNRNIARSANVESVSSPPGGGPPDSPRRPSYSSIRSSRRISTPRRSSMRGGSPR